MEVIKDSVRLEGVETSSKVNWTITPDKIAMYVHGNQLKHKVAATRSQAMPNET